MMEANGTIVWSAGRGWHDGGKRVRVVLDGAGRIVVRDASEGEGV